MHELYVHEGRSDIFTRSNIYLKQMTFSYALVYMGAFGGIARAKLYVILFHDVIQLPYAENCHNVD